MSDRPFDMPDASHSFAVRGAWLVQRFTEDLQLGATFRGGGIVGNLGFESGGLKIMQEQHPISGKGGWGWEQATGPRRRAMEAWAAAKGFDLSGDQANYGFILVELQGSFAFVVTRLRAATTLEQAVLAFGIYDEAPAGTSPGHLPGYLDRLTYARQAMAALDPATPSTPPPVDAAIPTAIRELQTALQTLGLYHGAIDGDFGPQTTAALQAWRATL